MAENTIPDGDPVAERVALRTGLRQTSRHAGEVRRLLDAGLEVMRRAGTTSSPRVADIVAAAGLSNEAFYRHFASKEALVAAILEDGANRLAGYVDHQMAKATTPEEKLRRWVEGVMAQAVDPQVASSTLAVLWNGGRVSDRARSAGSHHAVVGGLLREPLRAMGSSDPERDAGLISQAVMGRMEEFLWRREVPTERDTAHAVAFCSAAVTATRRPPIALRRRP